MALDNEDARSGFRHSDVVTFINQEVLRNGGGPDFYMTYRSRPWNEIEDELQSVVADLNMPHNLKRAYAWSALALSVRVATRQRQQQARRVQRLQEQVEERETATWALASQLQRLREEHKQTIMQLRRTRQSLQQALSEREALRRQLLQAERQTQAVEVSSQSPQLRADTWPVTTEERNKLLVATSQRRQLEAQEEVQNASAGGVQYVQGAQDPWAQVVQPLAPMPCPRHMPYPMPFPYPPPPPPRVLSEAEGAAAAAAAAAATATATATAAAAYPAPQMPAGVMCAPAMWPVVLSQEEVALLWDQRIKGQGEGPHFGGPVGYFQNAMNQQQPQDQMPRTPDGSSSEAEGSPAPHV